MKRYILVVLAISLAFFVSCKSSQKSVTVEDRMAAESEKFMEEETTDKDEAFRVLLSTDEYKVVAKNFADNLSRAEDPSGDKFSCEELAPYDKINEVREGILKISLYPETAKIMQIRFVRSTFLREIDSAITQDMKRWSFNFKEKNKGPYTFNVRYRVVLKKKVSDEQIMEEIRENMKEKNKQ